MSTQSHIDVQAYTQYTQAHAYEHTHTHTCICSLACAAPPLLQDSVARSSYYKYHHPKECLISGGVLNSAINLAAGKVTAADMEDDVPAISLEYLYPYGATLTVQKPSVR